jgi:hypothetical protein
MLTAWPSTHKRPAADAPAGHLFNIPWIALPPLPGSLAGRMTIAIMRLVMRHDAVARLTASLATIYVSSVSGCRKNTGQ